MVTRRKSLCSHSPSLVVSLRIGRLGLVSRIPPRSCSNQRRRTLWSIPRSCAVWLTLGSGPLDQLYRLTFNFVREATSRLRHLSPEHIM